MAIVRDILEFQKLCKEVYIVASSGYYKMVRDDWLTVEEIAVLSHYSDSEKYVCVLSSSIPNDRIYARYEYIKETHELHENFYIQFSKREYKEGKV